MLRLGMGGSSSGRPNFKCQCVYLMRSESWERHFEAERDEFLFVVDLVAHSPDAQVDADCLEQITLCIEKFEAST